MSTTVFKSKNSCNTLLAIQNQMMSCLGNSYQADKTTTINTKRNVIPEIGPVELGGVLPRVRYFGIGIKGFANITSDNNISQPYQPSAEEFDLYEPIPFRCVRTPLDTDVADMYRMVTTTTVNGQKYYLYWLKKISFLTSTVNLTKVDADGNETEYTVDASANLNPTPSDLFFTDLSQASTRVVASITGECRITGAEVLEAINVLYGGDLRRARISEVGTYSGIEVGLGADTVNEIPARTEAAYVQLCTHECSLGNPVDKDDDLIVNHLVFQNGSCVLT